MKKYLFFIAVAAVAVAVFMGLAGCSDGSSDNGPEVTPAVSLKPGEAAKNLLSFTVIPQNADKCAYACVEKGEPLPDDAEILSGARPVAAGEASVIVVEDLKPATDYIILAAVSAGGTVGETARLEMTTLAADSPDAVYLDRVAEARYYGINEEGGPADYYIQLSDTEVELDENNYWRPAADGCLLNIDLWCAASPDGSGFAIESGTYAYSGANTAMTFDPFYTLATVREQDELTQVEFENGSIAVSKEGPDYIIKAEMVSKGGEKITYIFTGPIEFANFAAVGDGPIDEDINTAFVGADAICYGDRHGVGSFSFDIFLYDAPLDAAGFLSEPGVLLGLEINTAVFDDNDEPYIPAGTYRLYDDFRVGSLVPGSYYIHEGRPVFVGSFVEKDTENEIFYGFVSDGTVAVEASGTDYTVTVDLVLENGHTVKGSYRGSVIMDDERGLKPGGGGYSTLRRDTYPDLSGIEKGTLYYLGDFWRVGLSDFIIDISSEDVAESMQIDIFCDRSLTTDIATGTYDMMPARMPDCFVPYAIMQGYPNESHFFGTWYREWDFETDDYADYAPATYGSMEVSKEGDIYTVSYKFKDDCTDPNKIEGTWSGPLEFVSQAMSLVPRKPFGIREVSDAPVFSDRRAVRAGGRRSAGTSGN